MPLKLTSLSDRGQLAALNRWADGIETQQRATTSLTLFVNQGVQTLLNTPPTTSSSVIVGPGFTNRVDVATTYFTSNLMGSAANGIGSVLFALDTQITTGHFNFNVQSFDAVSFYDWGIYGPFTGVETTLPLKCHIGGQQFTSNGSQKVPWIGSVTLAPGFYFLALTSDGAPPGLQIYAGAAISWLYGTLVSTPSTGSGVSLSLPASITVQAIAPVAQTSGAGAGQPQNIVFNLY
jgi:hypothetical protein